uniref:Uncharacterized protein n=1 Tax=Chenopodium quinoa TaxID=63459 RepID=A0A803MVI4_CHEQI
MLHVRKSSLPRRSQRKFKFEAYWLANPDCEKVIKAAWEDSSHEPAHIRLSYCASSLEIWAAETFGCVKRKIRSTEEKLKQVQGRSMNNMNLALSRSLSQELDELHLQEETYWHARARANEFRDGDRNTFYFHHKANARRVRNTIEGLENNNADWVSNASGIEGHDPSFTWRSIWGAKALLIHGMRWHVGNGLNVQVWKDNWLSSDTNFGVPSPPPNRLHDPDIVVSDLIDHHIGQWDLAALNMHLEAADIEKVLFIPLIQSPTNDSLFWSGTSDGSYTVKTGYWLGMSDNGGINTLGNQKAWKVVWNVDGPPKLKHFLWRICTKTIPVNAELFRRHIKDSPCCQFCPTQSESINHALFECCHAKLVWESGPLWDVIRERSDECFSISLPDLADQLSKQDMSLLVALAWSVWTSRNKRIFENPAHDSCALAVNFTKYVMDYNVYAARVFGRSVSKKVLSASSWTATSNGVVKINTDAALLPDKSVGLGVVARDSAGCILFTVVRKRTGHWDPGVAEAAALCFGVEMANRLGHNAIWLESDAMTSVQSIVSKRKGHSYFFAFVERILCIVSSFSFFFCSHVSRSGNAFAHLIARSCPSDTMENVRFAPFPESFLTLAGLDINT